jgi:hypothetical protein
MEIELVAKTSDFTNPVKRLSTLETSIEFRFAVCDVPNLNLIADYGDHADSWLATLVLCAICPTCSTA